MLTLNCSQCSATRA